MYNFDHLNAEQKEAVLAGDGPVMVIAGAGSGKTRVITERISYLIKEKQIYPHRILAVTFTNKAAGEMKERIARNLNTDIRSMWISTFHSFCARFLRENADLLTTCDRYFNILDTEDSVKVCKDALKIFNQERGFELNIKPQYLQKVISSTKNIKDYAISDKISIFFPDLIKYYDNLLKELNALDFDDLLIKTVELLEEKKDLREKYQNKFDHILIDEFQDTNHIQYKLMKLLVNEKRNIFIVGDQDQSIYSFRGALVSNINQFKKDYKDAKQVILKTNYRSTASILDIANKLINNNTNRIKKDLVAATDENIEPIFKEFAGSKTEINYITDVIKVLRDANKTDIAILVRSNHLSRSFEDNFIKHGIPYRILAGQSFYKRQEVKDIIAYLRLLIFDNENFSFERVINVPKRRFGEMNMVETRRVAEANNLSYFDSLPLLTSTNIGVMNAKALHSKLTDLKKRINELSFQEIETELLEVTGYKEMIEKNEEVHRLENINAFFDSLREKASQNIEDSNGEISNVDVIRKTLLDIALITTLDESDASDAVNILTYHTAKGLEFETVFMPFMLEGIFPSYYATLEGNVSEERRVCYVGITRAKKRLYITKSDYKFAGNEHKVASTFWYETKPLTDDEIRTNRKFEQLRNTNPTVETKEEAEDLTIPLNVGDKVEHKAFGEGIIVAIEDNRLNIAFNANHGVKIIQNNKKFLKKI